MNTSTAKKGGSLFSKIHFLSQWFFVFALALTTGCVSLSTHVQKNEKDKVAKVLELDVIFQTSNQVNFGGYKPEFSVPGKDFSVIESVKASVEASLKSGGRKIRHFQVSNSQAQTNQMLAGSHDKPVLVLAESEVEINNGFNYVGFGFLMRKRNVFQTDIRPYAILKVSLLNFSEKDRVIAETYNSNLIERKEAPIVEGGKYAESAGQYNESDRKLMKASLNQWTQNTINALLADLALAKRMSGS